MTKTSGLAAALTLALAAAGCAAPHDAPLPPVATMEAPVAEPVPADETPAPGPTSVAALGLRGASAAAPAGGASAAAAGRAMAEDEAAIAISYPPTDESQLDALLTAVEAPPAAMLPAETEPVLIEAAAEPAPDAMHETAMEPAPADLAELFIEQPAAAASETAPETAPGIAFEPVAEPGRLLTETAPAPVAAPELVFAEAEPAAAVDSALEPEAELASAAAAEQSAVYAGAAPSTDDKPLHPDPIYTAEKPAAEPATPGTPRLEDFYTCDYAPAEQRGGVQLVACR